MTGKLIVLGLAVILAVAGLAALIDPSPGVNASNSPLVEERLKSTPVPAGNSDQPPAAQPAAATPAPAGSPEAGPENRADCNKIRGTDYLSVGERQWFLTHCISR